MNKTSIGYAIRRLVESVLDDVHTAMPGRIEAYDYTKQKAEVTPLVKRRYTDGTEEAFPRIVNVPVVLPRSATASLTFPIEKGDTGLLVFNERSLDRWLSKGGLTEAALLRKFDLSDVVFIPGMYPFTESSPAQNNDDLQLALNATTLTFKKNGDVILNGGNTITIKANGDIELGAGVLQKLMNKAAMDAFNLHTHLVAATPSTGATIATLVPTIPMIEATHCTTKVSAQ
jgi:hypothetical protein